MSLKAEVLRIGEFYFVQIDSVKHISLAIQWHDIPLLISVAAIALIKILKTKLSSVNWEVRVGRVSTQKKLIFR